MAEEVYTDEDGLLLVDSDGLAHVESCGAPDCCDTETWWPATECGGSDVVWVLTSALCNGGGSVGGKAIQIGETCYLVDTETATATDDLPGDAVTDDSGLFVCAEDCDSSPCADVYYEFTYCTRDAFRTASERVFVPEDMAELWWDYPFCADCCTAWKVNGICVGYPRASLATTNPPAASFIATDPPGSYTNYDGCCQCEATCDKIDRNFCNNYSPCDSFGCPSADDCPEPSSGQKVVAEHTCAYSYSERFENEDFTSGDAFGGDSDTYSFNGTANGTTRWSNGTSLVLDSSTMVYTGDCQTLGFTGGGPLTPFGYRLFTAFHDGGSRGIGQIGYFIWHFDKFGLSYSCLEMRPSLTFNQEVTVYLPSPGDEGWRQTDYSIDLTWTSEVEYSCDRYLIARTLNSTITEERRFGNTGTGPILFRQTITASMTAVLSGTMLCRTVAGNNISTAPCCDYIPDGGEGESMAAMAGSGGGPGLVGPDGWPLSGKPSILNPRGALARLLGANKAAGRFRL